MMWSFCSSCQPLLLGHILNCGTMQSCLDCWNSISMIYFARIFTLFLFSFLFVHIICICTCVWICDEGLLHVYFSFVLTYIPFALMVLYLSLHLNKKQLIKIWYCISCDLIIRILSMRCFCKMSVYFAMCVCMCSSAFS